MYHTKPNYIHVNKRKISYVQEFNGYKIKWSWLEKLLKKIGFVIELFETIEIIRYTNLDAKPLHIAISLAINDASYYGSDCKIIMGSEEFEELTGNKDVQQYFKFETGPFGNSKRGDYFNIPVYVYPHLKGWAVI